MLMKSILCMFISFIILMSCFKRQLTIPPRNNKDISHLNSRISNVLNDDWIIITEKNITTIYFCPSCNDPVPDSNSNIPFFSSYYAESRLKLNGPDSVAFLTAVNPPVNPSPSELKLYRRPDGILKITIRFDDSWNEAKYSKVKSMNDTLINALKRKGKDPERYSSFLDFRANIPDSSTWKKYLNDYDYYFQPIPYHSSLINKSIFIESGIPYDWTYPFYVDKSDSLYYLNEKNSMYYEYMRVMYSISYALGIEDYVYPH